MPALSPRQRFVQNRKRKQTLTFSITIATLVVLATVSALVFTGILPIPFGNEFSKATKYATPGTTPCLPEGATPATPQAVTVQILNTTSRQGLATTVTEMLAELGYQTLDPGNAAPEYSGTVEISAGPAAIIDAYTLARFFPKAAVVLSQSTDKTVTVLLGTFYDEATTVEEMQRLAESTSVLKAPPSCLPLAEDDLEVATARKDELDAMQSEAQSGAQSGEESDAQSGDDAGEGEPQSDSGE